MSVGYGAYIEKQARKAGIKAGRAEGIEENKQKVVMNMLSDGSLSDEKISFFADVSLEKVKELKNKMNQKK